MPGIEWLTYEEKYKKDLKELSYEWLEKYVSVEPEDIRILENPEEIIIKPGGEIIFARYQGEIVGTVSLIKVDEETFELAKLAVTEKAQGLKIGNQLMDKALEFAKSKGATKVILYTNRILTAAIVVYQKYGFVEIPMLENKYLESDLKMEKKL